MLRHPFRRLFFGLLAALVCVSAGGLVVRRADAQGNLLQNPGFEGAYTPFNGDGTRLMAAGWSPWNVVRKSNEPTWANITPQYTQATRRIRGGSAAQSLFELYATFTAGVYQRVTVAPGVPLRFSAHLNVWSSTRDEVDASIEPGAVSLQVGIDPTGGTDGTSAAIVWSPPVSFYDEYRLLTVDATASGNFATVFVRASMLEPVRNNHVYIDDASLIVSSGTLPTPTPVVVLPTSTPLNGPTPTLTETSIVPTREGPPVTPTNTPPGFVASPTPTFFFPTPTLEGTRLPSTPGIFPTPTGPSGVLAGLPGRVDYVVRSGDTLLGIAVQFNSRVDAIRFLNNLSGDLIIVGQRLVIPVPGTSPTITPLFPTPGVSGGTPPVLVAVLNGPTVNGIGTYITQPGDTLEAVARRYNISLQELIRLNGIVNPAALVIGQVLAVPGPGNNPPGGTIAPTIIPTRPGGNVGIPGVTHVVQRGENLFRISLRYNTTISALMALNGIVNPNLIYVGQVLRLR